jgi:uracil phosphoribosyltransferase
MIVNNLSANNSELLRFVSEIRDVEIQKDSLRFRRNLERIGEIMAYEMSKEFIYSPHQVTTPLGIASSYCSDNEVVIATILRAGLPFHQGFLSYLDKAENAFVSAYRKYKDALKFEICIEYLASPSLENKTLIIADPMLATGSSLEMAYGALRTKGKPTHTYIASVIASQQAIDYLGQRFPDDSISLWTAAIDPELNEHAYIIPGLGDAGDLAFGVKL